MFRVLRVLLVIAVLLTSMVCLAQAQEAKAPRVLLVFPADSPVAKMMPAQPAMLAYVGPDTKKLIGKNPAAWIDQIVGAFKKYNVVSIELWIKAAVTTGEVLTLFVDVKGEGGVKVILKPQK